jgi:hypothetical protein
VVWAEGLAGARDIRAQRVSADGSIAWGPGGRAVCDASGDQGAISAVEDGHGGALVAWEDYRFGGEADIRAQHLAADGGAAWGVQGAAVIVAPGHQFAPVIARDGSGGALMTWVDGPSSARASFLRARPVRGEDVPRLILAKAAPGRAQLTWQTWSGDARSLTLLRKDAASDWHEVSTQRPDPAGVLQLEERGLQPGTRAAFRLAGLAERPATYYEEVALDIPMPRPFAFRSASMLRAGNGLRLVFTLEIEEPVAFEVFDVQGRRIESRSLETEGPGDYALEVPLTRRIPPGLFFVRLNHGRVTRTVRMVVTR